MNTIIESVNNRIAFLKRVIRRAEKEKGSFPEGRLRTSRSNGRIRYYKVSKERDTSGEYLPKNDLAETYWGPLPEVSEVKPVQHNKIHGIYIASCMHFEENLELAKNTDGDSVVRFRLFDDDFYIRFDVVDKYGKRANTNASSAITSLEAAKAPAAQSYLTM